MSYEAILDTDEAIHVATNKGWNDVTRWIETLPHNGDFEPLHHLAEHGESKDLDELPDAIDEAIEKQIPSPSVRKTLAGLLAFIKGNADANQLIISSGA